MATTELGSGAPDIPREGASARAVDATAALGQGTIGGDGQACGVPVWIVRGAGLAAQAIRGGGRPSLGANAGDAGRGD